MSIEYERLKHLDKRRVARLRGVLERIGILVKSPGRLKLLTHETDNRIYECAAAAKTQFIVTGNTKHFKKPHAYTKIITARQPLKLLEAGHA